MRTHVATTVLAAALGLGIPLSAEADAQDLDDLFDENEDDAGASDDAADEDEDAGGFDGGKDEIEPAGKEEEEEPEEDGAELSVDSGELTADAREYERALRIHAFLGAGYSLPVADLGADHFETFGGLPIHFGGDFMVIDALAVGLRFRVGPLFENLPRAPSQSFELSARTFEFHLTAGYSVYPGLRLYLALGAWNLKATYDIDGGGQRVNKDTYFSLGPGLSYTFYLAELGPGGIGIDVGAELSMAFGGDFESNASGDYGYGTVAGGMFFYPLVYVACRYSLGVL
ncbi:MAG: hypothetical protein R6V85_14600 [Polyangia bacterium]